MRDKKEFDFGRNFSHNLGRRQMVHLNWVIWGDLIRVLYTKVWAYVGKWKEDNALPQSSCGRQEMVTRKSNESRAECGQGPLRGTWPLVGGHRQPVGTLQGGSLEKTLYLPLSPPTPLLLLLLGWPWARAGGKGNFMVGFRENLGRVKGASAVLESLSLLQCWVSSTWEFTIV